jgi:hypothetical protein
MDKDAKILQLEKKIEELEKNTYTRTLLEIKPFLEKLGEEVLISLVMLPFKKWPPHCKNVLLAVGHTDKASYDKFISILPAGDENERVLQVITSSNGKPSNRPSN